jgi:hypothetical protein
MIAEPVLRRWVSHAEPDDLRRTLPELRCVYDRYATEVLRKAMPRATFHIGFPFTVRQIVHDNGQHREADVGIAQCYVWSFNPPIRFGERKVGVVLACFQQAQYWTNFALIEKLTLSEIENAARLATRFTEFCPNCRRFGALKHTGTWEQSSGLLMEHHRCTYCGALDERLFEPKRFREVTPKIKQQGRQDERRYPHRKRDQNPPSTVNTSVRHAPTDGHSGRGG